MINYNHHPLGGGEGVFDNDIIHVMHVGTQLSPGLYSFIYALPLTIFPFT